MKSSLTWIWPGDIDLRPKQELFCTQPHVGGDRARPAGPKSDASLLDVDAVLASLLPRHFADRILQIQLRRRYEQLPAAGRPQDHEQLVAFAAALVENHVAGIELQINRRTVQRNLAGAQTHDCRFAGRFGFADGFRLGRQV